MGKWFQEKSLFVISLGMIVGLAMAEYFRFTAFFLLFCGYLLFLALRMHHQPTKRLVLMTSLAAWLSAGYFYVYEHFHRSTLTSLFTEEATFLLKGRIDSPVKRDGDRARFFLMADEYGGEGQMIPLTPRERIAITVKLGAEAEIGQIEQWRVGHLFTGHVTLKRPDGARNPHAFDYARYLRWQAVSVIGAADMGQIRVDTSKRQLTTFFENWQKRESAQLQMLFQGDVTAGYMKSLLLGMQDEVDPTLEELYSDFGLVHILAISGFHITLVSSFFLWAMERAGAAREKALLSCIVFILLYVLMVGAGPSAVRAGVMGGLALWGVYAKKRMTILDLWGISCILMLLWNPYDLWNIGFQLSFAVTLGLILLVPMFVQVFAFVPKAVRTFLAVTIVSQLVSFPFLVYWFHQFSPLSGVLNLLAVPLLSFVVLGGGYVALLLSHVHVALAYFFVQMIDSSLTMIHRVLEWVHRFVVPYSHWPHPYPGWLVAYAGFLALLPIAWKYGYHRKRDMARYAVCFVLLLAAARQPFAGHDEVRITFLDVGQGDSIVVEIGRKKVYLIDGGGNVYVPEESWRKKREPYDVGKKVVLPFLRSLGIHRIDHIVMTHGDLDHIGGLGSVIPRFDVGSVLRTNQEPTDKERELIALLEKKQVPVKESQAGSYWLDDAEIGWTILSPFDKTTESGNNASVVLLLTVHGINVLFTGDLEEAGEESLLHNWKLPPIDIVKVGHHGSKSSTSETFIQSIRPKVAIISAGRGNRYGHPNPVVLDRLRKTGARVYRTDRQGAIRITIRPNEINDEVRIRYNEQK